MELSRLKKVLAGFSVAAIALTQISTALAAYTDVPTGSWYESAVSALSKYLDATQTTFRPGDLATRAEFVKLVVEMNGGILSTAPAVPTFDDVAPSAWYYGYMEDAAADKWVQGDGACVGSHPCYARPTANINRAEAAKLLVTAFGLDKTGVSAQFVDNPSGQWYTDVIQTAADHCVLQGDDSTGAVRPGDNMNRAEMVVMLNRVDQGLTYGKDCGTATTPSGPAITSATAVTASKVDVEFNTDVDATAAATASDYAVTQTGAPALAITSVVAVNSKTVEITMTNALTSGANYTVTVSNMKTAAGDVFSDSAAFTGYNSIPVGNGTLEIALSSKNPVGDTVPGGARGVTMVSLDLTASCDDDVTLSDITVLHEGFGHSAGIDGVYAEVDGARVSRSRSIDSKDQTADIRFTTPVVVPKCKTVTMDIAADINADVSYAGDEHNLTVELASDVVGNAKSTTGNFPLKGNTFKVASVSGGKVTVGYRSISPNTAYVGDKSIVVGKFEFDADSVEDQTLYSVTLHQDGTVADGDIQNLRIRRTDGTVITNTVAQFSNKFATLTFNPPFTILSGDKINLEVLADVNGGAAKNSTINIDETSDIFAVGSLYGYGVNGQLYGSNVAMDATTSESSEVLTVKSGEFTIEVNGPSTQNYTRDQHGATLANIKLTTGGDPVDVRKMFVMVAGTSTGHTLAYSGNGDSNISDVIDTVALKDTTTGRSISANRLTTSGTSGVNTGTTTATYQIYEFDDFTVSGADTYQLNVDFIDNGTGHHPEGGDQFRAIVCGQPSETDLGADATGCSFNSVITATTAYDMQIESSTTGDKVHDVRPGGSIIGNAQNIADASLNVAVKTLASSGTAVKNSKDIKMLRFESTAGDAKDVRITKLVFQAASGALTNGVNYTLWADTDGNGVVDTKIDSGKAASATQGTVTFDTIQNGGYVVPKSATVAFEVHADIAGSLQTVSSQNNYVLQLKFATSGPVEAETVDRGSSITVTPVTATSPLYTLVSQGNLYVTKDTVSVNSHMLLGGTLGDPVLRLNLRAEFEPIDVTKLFVTNSTTANSVDHFDLYLDGATSPFATATTSNCQTADDAPSNTFCASMQSQQLIVDPSKPDVKVLVRPRIKSDVDGGVDTDSVLLHVDATVGSSLSATGAIRARGVNSSNNLYENYSGHPAGVVVIGGTSSAASNVQVTGVTNAIVMSKIGTIANADPHSQGSTIQSNAWDIGSFQFTALDNSNTNHGSNKVTLTGVVFTVQATNVQLDPAKFYVHLLGDTTTADMKACVAYTSAGVAIAGGATHGSGSMLVRCDLNGTPNTQINPAGNLTLNLQGSVYNTRVVAGNTTNLVTSLTNFTDRSVAAFGVSSGQNHLLWNDQDDASGTLFYWTEYSTDSINSTSYGS